MMGLVGIADIAAIVGGAIYIYVTVGTLLGARSSTPARPARTFHPIPRSGAHGGRAELRFGGFAAPAPSPGDGVPGSPSSLYYFINWKYLSQVWGLS